MMTGRNSRPSLTLTLLACVLLVVLLLPAAVRAAGTADEIHYSFTGPTSVAFDWRGTATDIRYGTTTSYGTTTVAHTPSPLPFSSPGPFQEVELTGLARGATYHYSIGGGPDHTFATAPNGAFRFDLIADIGSSTASSKVATTQGQVAADNPAFVLAAGDLTYANDNGQAAVDQHFNDVMSWSQSAAYMPAWGNHEWETAVDDLRNYKGRFKLPNAQASPGAPAAGCCGEDWGWFDAGGVRFISYPEPYASNTWSGWQGAVDSIMAAAQADSSIRYIVTYGHRPAYSTGFHAGDAGLASILNGFGDRYSKYILNLNGHSHDYERFQPIHGVTNITAGGGGAGVEAPWTTIDPNTAFRAMHLVHLRVDVTSSGLRVDAVCGPATSQDDTTCPQGSVLDSYLVGAAPPPPPPAATIYVDRANASCSNTGAGSAAQPFCTISAAASRVVAGQTVQVAAGTYPERVAVSGSGFANAPITFAAAPGATVTVTGQANGFYISGKNWITVSGFTVTNTSDYGLYVSSGSSHITLANNHVSNSGDTAPGKTKSGIYFSNVSDSLIVGNTADHNSSYGIYLTSGSTRNVVDGNTSFSNAMGYQRAASGIRLYSSPANTISNNLSHDNEDSGIEFDTNADDNLTFNNVLYNNGDHGIDDYKSTDQTIIANTVYKNVTAGINIEGNSTGATIANNIAVDNGIKSPRTHSNIRVESGSTSGTTLDYDLVYLTTADTLLIWNSVSYTSLAAFRSASGQETHAIQADPRWTNVAGGNFHLTAGSPAIDSANAGIAGQPSSDVEGTPRIDDPITPNTGVGIRAYDDRGAYEFNAPNIDHVVISPSTSIMVAGDSRTYTAQAFDASGNPAGDVTGSTTFSVAPDGTCTGNVCTANKAGTHTVTGNVGGKTSTASLSVTAGAPDHLVLAPASATIASGGSQAYTVEGRDQYDNSLGDVSSSTVLSISPDGSCLAATCSASAAGPHTVTGTLNGATGSASLQVTGGALDHIVVSPSSASIVAGGSQTYVAQGFDGSGNPLGDVTSSTSFSIGPNGSCSGATCTATASGAHTVTGNDGGKTGTASLSVTAGALDHLVLAPASATIASGGSQAYTAEGRDQYDNSLGDVTSSTTFSIGPNGSCSAATCTATSAGGHTVTGTKAAKTGSASLQVTGGVLDHIVISPSSASIGAGGSQAYTAEGFDASNNSLGDVTTFTTFSIGPNGSCTGGSCTATSAGAHTVTGSNGGKTGTATLSVTAGALDHLVLSPTPATTAAGNPQPYTAEGRDQYDNSLGDVTASTTFSIGPNGSCTGASCTATLAGTHTVTGSNSGKTGTASLSVTAGVLDHLALSPASAVIAAGGSQTYTAEGRDQYDNSLGDVTSTTTFSIDASGSCSGASCTATSAGAQTVTGTKAGKTGTASLQVTAAVLDHIVISPSSASIGAGGSQAYTAEGFDASNNSLGDVTSSTTFSIGPNGSCTGGSCTATSAGAHTVTGTAEGKTGTASLSVTPGSLDHLVLSPASATITAGGSQAYTAEGRDQYDNSLGDVTSSTTFSIGPNGSCTVATCTATASGAHTVTGSDGGKTGTASLSVTAGAPDHLVLAPATATIASGGSQTYTAQGRDQYNNSLGDVTSSTAFSISPDGSCLAATCTASAAGTHTVTGSLLGATGTASLQVTAVLDHIVVSPSSASITAGGSQAYTAEGFDASNHSLGDVTSSTSFSIGPNGSCSGATCTATSAGAHTVTGNDGGKTGTASLSVTAGALDHLVLAPASATIASGGSQAYTAEGRDQYDNSLGDVTSTTTFSIGPNGSCSAASCTATSAGAHTVTGTKAAKTGTASLQVTAAVVLDHIVISPSSGSIGAGGSQAYTAEGFDASNNSLGDVTSSTTFSIGPNGSCTGGSCTATSAGTHLVTGNDAGKTSTASLTVTPGPLDHLALAPASATIASGGSQAYTAEGRDQYNNSLGDVTASTSFSIGPNGSCTLATCTATASGAHTVTGNAGGKTGTASLQVGGGALDHIVISPASATIVAGGSQAYTAQGFDAANNSLGDVTSSTTFSIAPNGSCSGNTCTATSGGPHTVTGNDAGKTSTASLTINLVTNPGFETDTSGWNTSGSSAGVVLTRVSGGHSGNWAAQMNNTATTTGTYAALQDSPNWVATTSAGTYTGTMWVRADTAGAVFKLKFQEFSGSTLVGSVATQVTLTTSWQQVTVTYTTKSPGSTLDFQSYVSNPAPGNAFYADDVSIILG